MLEDDSVALLPAAGTVSLKSTQVFQNGLVSAFKREKCSSLGPLWYTYLFQLIYSVLLDIEDIKQIYSQINSKYGKWHTCTFISGHRGIGMNIRDLKTQLNLFLSFMNNKSKVIS